MNDFEKSNKYLIGGSIYSFILAPLLVGLGFLLIHLTYAIAARLDIVTNFFLFSFYVILYFGGIYCFILAVVSLAAAVMSLVAREKNKRRFYRFLIVFSGVALNPFSFRGARMGVRACTPKAAA